MNDRHWLGDIGLAVLLALPLSVLAAPGAVPGKPATAASGKMIASAAPASPSGRVSVLG